MGCYFGQERYTIILSSRQQKIYNHTKELNRKVSLKTENEHVITTIIPH